MKQPSYAKTYFLILSENNIVRRFVEGHNGTINTDGSMSLNLCWKEELLELLKQNPISIPEGSVAIE